MLSEKEIAEKVHKDLILRFKYVPDLEQYQTIEYWASPEETLACGLRGDCDDFAKLAQYLLDKNGIKSRLVECKVETGDYHLICITESGWILDNRENFLATKEDLQHYIFIKQSGYLGDTIWHEIIE